MISIPAMLERAARLNPQGQAMQHLDRKHSWADLLDRVSRLGAALDTLGLDEGDRVAILSLNSDRYYESVFAIPWAGLCMVPLNTRWALLENDYALRDSQARILLFDDAFTEQAQQLVNDIDGLSRAVYMGDGDCPSWALDYEQAIDDHTPIPASLRGGDDMAGVFYTGGTTGFPKGVMQSHRAIYSSALGALPDFQMTRDSVYLHVAPMFHMADFAGSMGTTLCAASHYVLKAFDPSEVLRTLSAEPGSLSFQASSPKTPAYNRLSVN